MIKKITLAVLIVIVFFALNYIFAFFAPSPWSPPAPVWMFSDSTVKNAYFNKLPWYKQALILTMSYEGGNIENGKGGIRTEKAETGTPEFTQENMERMMKVGKCNFDGKEGYWEFYVETYSFFNIPVSSGTISCDSGLAS